MLVNSCNSSKSEGKMKKSRQVGTCQSSCGEQRRRSPYLIVGRKKMKEVVRSEKDKGGRQVGKRHIVK